MVSMKKSLVIGSFLILNGISTQTIANEAALEGSLKLVMQGLLSDTQKLTGAMLTEDYVLMEQLSKRIADHPKPSMATRMKLMKAMGADMAQFKKNDGVVHGAAVNMTKAAQEKDIKRVGENFQTMINGCLSCHSQFKSRVSEILK